MFFFRKGYAEHYGQVRARAEALGVHFDIEVLPTTTDVVSAWPLIKLLDWVKLSALPPYTQFHSPEWLVALLDAAESNRSASASAQPTVIELE